MYPRTRLDHNRFVPTNVVDNGGYTPRMAENMEPFKFRIRPSMLKRAMRIAEKREDNLSEILRDAIKDYIRRNEHLLFEDEQEGNRPHQAN